MLSHGLRKLTGGWIDARRIRKRDTGRYRWHITPAGDALFGPRGPDLDVWIRDALAVVAKQGPQRTVYRVNLRGGAIYAKRCRVQGLRAWLRECVRPAKARLEFENAVMLRDRGLPVVEPLAWATQTGRWPGESIFITKAQENAEPLQGFLDSVFPKISSGRESRLRKNVSRELGILMARLHDAGVAHPDPHPGNLLATPRDRSLKFALIDLHAIRFGPALSWRESLTNLVLFNRWFQIRASRSDRLRFWQAYVAHRTTLPAAGPLMLGRMAKEVERRTERSNARFWVARFDRYRKCNREFHIVDVGRTRGYAVRELPAKFVERLAADPDAPFRDAASQVLKDSPTSSVIEIVVPTPDGPVTAIYKRFTPRWKLSPLKNLFRPSAALRSWLYGHNLLDRGLPTARPLCVLERFHLGFLRAEGYLLAAKVEDADLLHEAAAKAPSWRTVRTATERVGQLLHQLHHKRVSHRDLKASNILIDSKLRPVFIDLVGVTPRSAPIPRDIRVRDVARMAASFLHCPSITRTDKLRVLRAYRAWGLHGRGDWKSWWRAIDAAIQRKQAKNARRGRPLA